MPRFQKTPILTKSDFQRYLQCHKYLWLNKKRKDLLPETTPEQQAIFDQGYAVEDLTHLLFEDGVEVTENFQKGAKQTKAIMAAGHQVIYQATAFKRPLLVRGDILKWNPETELWDLYEVKSSSEVKDQHITDAAFQKYAFEQDRIQIGKTHLIHVNKEYVRDGELDPKQLFTIAELTEQVEEIMPFILAEIPKALDWLPHTQEPNKRVGKHCKKPYPCPFINYCWKDIPEDSVFEISRLSEDKLETLLDQNIIQIGKVPKDFPLTENQSRHVEAIQSGKTTINKKAIKGQLDGLEYPLYFLDYETFGPAIPLFDGASPFQHIPFQYSLHILESADADLKHTEFLATDNTNPVPKLVKQLQEDIGPKGTVIVWFKGFECSRNTEMGKMMPKHSTFLEDINERTFDLMEIFKDGHYVDPHFKGSHSIKKVLPVLVPELSYKELEINNGAIASLAWPRLISEETDQDEKDQTKEALLQYCKLDTLAMVEIWRVLKKLK